MKFYDILLKLSGRTGNSVRKYGLSAPEVMLLNEIHGGDQIAELVEVKTVDFSPSAHRKLRATLAERYNYNGQQHNRAAMDTLFSVQRTAPLPEAVTMDELKPEMPELVEEDDEVEAVEEPAKAKAAKPPPEDPKDAVKASLKKLGAPIPKGNASIETLREALTEAQKAAAEKAAAEKAAAEKAAAEKAAAEANQPETVL